MLQNKSAKPFIILAWLLAIGATIGSLFFQYSWDLPPCVLCWFQRISIYPMVFLFAVALIRKDKNVIWYALPLLIAGWLVSSYHILLYYQIIPEAIAPCQAGVSCTTKFFEWFGFITIPLMSWIGHTVLIALCLIIKKTTNYEIGS